MPPYPKMETNVTVVVVTSPAPCHPSTEMVERLLLSLRLLHGLEATSGDGASGGGGSSDATAAVSVLISCDGYEVGSKKKRSAAVSEERAANYDEYKARLLRTYGAQRAAAAAPAASGRGPRPSWMYRSASWAPGTASGSGYVRRSPSSGRRSCSSRRMTWSLGERPT